MVIVALALGVWLAGAVAVAAATGPWRVWPLFIVLTVGTVGMMPLGYTIVDEFLTAAILVGVFMAASLTRRHARSAGSVSLMENLHYVAYLTLIVYLIGQSVRGVIELNSPQKLRWVVMYAMLGAISLIVSRWRYPPPTMRQTAHLIMWSSLAYLAAYILHGVTGELLRGMSRWDLQLREVGTTAYTLLPLSVAIPAAVICISDPERRIRRGGWATLAVALVCALYYDSRIAQLAIAGLGIAAAPRLGIKRVLTLGAAAVILLLVFGSILWPQGREVSYADYILGGFVQALSGFWQSEEKASAVHDIDRWVHMRVAFEAIAADWKAFLFGYGYRVHGFKISIFIFSMYERFRGSGAGVREDTSTEGFTALVVDTGVVGLFLVILNLGIVVVRILGGRRNPYRIVLAAVPPLLFAWLFVINVLDATLFYVAMMPSGLLLLLAQPESATATQVTMVRPRRRRFTARSIPTSAASPIPSS